MQNNVQIQDVLEHWALRGARVEGPLRANSDSSRLVFSARANAGQYVLKGFPDETPEATIQSNVRAHLFLGYEKDLVPRIFPLKAGGYYIRDQGYWFYLMAFIEGRRMEETPEDEYRIGQAARRLHSLRGYELKSPENQSKKRFYGWFRDRAFVREFDAILDGLPDFEQLDQCFVHTDIGPHNTMLRQDGRVVFIDLDDAGTGSRYLDLG